MKRTRSKPTRRNQAIPPDQGSVRAPVRDRILKFLYDHRSERYADSRVATELGCSRQYVHALLPAGYRDAQPTVDSRLKAFIQAHPEAALPKARGGMTFKEIAAHIHTSPATVSAAWRRLDLVDRSLLTITEPERNHRNYGRRKAQHNAYTREWSKRNLEKARAIRRSASRRWRAKVIRDEVCIVCRITFPWTNSREHGRRYKGTRVVCSPRCAAAAPRTEARII